MEDIGRGRDDVFLAMFMALLIFVPLGLWKAIEILWWLCTAVNITW